MTRIVILRRLEMRNQMSHNFRLRPELLTDCVPINDRAFLTRDFAASKSKRFASKTPFSFVIVRISPSKNFFNGWMKQIPVFAMKSRSHWPSRCSAWPVFIKALPYDPSLPNDPPASIKSSPKYSMLDRRCGFFFSIFSNMKSSTRFPGFGT